MLLLQRSQERKRKQAHSPDQLFASAMISEFKNYWDIILMDMITSYRSETENYIQHYDVT